MENNVFELIHNDGEKVVLKVNADDLLIIAMNPWVSSNYAYITVTKGAKHVLTVTKKDGKTFSFHWGEGGHTLISENLETLRKNAVAFIESKKIWLEWVGDCLPTEVKIFYNPNFRCWEFTAKDDKKNYQSKCWYNPDATCWVDVMWDVAAIFPDLEIFDWTKKIAPTGIDVWEARL